MGWSCIISFLYIKPQLGNRTSELAISCIISFLYIKPQLNDLLVDHCFVVLYRFSTSNHNDYIDKVLPTLVVLYRFSTSNHNSICIN